MKWVVIVPGKFVSLNEYIYALKISRGKWNKGQQLKKDDMTIIVPCIKAAFKGRKPKTPITLHYKYYEPNTRRDKDNISGYFHKVFQDAMQEAEIIDNDGWNDIKGFKDSFEVDKYNPRIEITVTESRDD